MSSKTYIQYYSNGTSKEFKRKKQGRTPLGLGKPKCIRLKKEDEDKMIILRDKLGIYWNENAFIRNAVSEKLCNSVYTELLIP